MDALNPELHSVIFNARKNEKPPGITFSMSLEITNASSLGSRHPKINGIMAICYPLVGYTLVEKYSSAGGISLSFKMIRSILILHTQLINHLLSDLASNFKM